MQLLTGSPPRYQIGEAANPSKKSEEGSTLGEVGIGGEGGCNVVYLYCLLFAFFLQGVGVWVWPGLVCSLCLHTEYGCQ